MNTTTTELREFPLAPPGSNAPYILCVAIAVPTLVLGGFIFAMSFAPNFVEIVVDRDGITVKGDLYGSRLGWDKIRGEAVGPVGPEDRATRRTNGLGLPNYRSGWFGLASGRKGLLFVSDWSRAVRVPTTDGYDLIVSPETTRRFLDSVRSEGASPGRFDLATNAASASPGWWLVYIPLAATLGTGFLVLSLARSIGRARLALEPAGLRIKGALYGRLIPWEKLRVDEVRAGFDFRGLWRSNGVGLPGYLAGWFRRWRGGGFLMFVTDRARALEIPTDLGYALVVSPDRPDDFLSALRASK